MKTTIYFLTITFISTVLFSCKKTETPVQVEAPTISSFFPVKDSSGGIVTVLGTNFSSTIANNEVRFNNTLATIVSATSTTLKVNVPIGLTTNSTITVKTSGQTATSSTSFRFVSAMELLIVGKWFYKYSILSDTEYVNNNNQIQIFPWPFLPGVNPQTNYDSSFNYITFNDTGISNNSRYGWGIGQAGTIYRDTISYNQSSNIIYLSFPAGINTYSGQMFSYPGYQDTITINSITQNSLVIFRRYHQKHYANSNNILNKKLSLDSLIKY